DPSSINYCDLKCGDEENSACKCDPLDRRSEDLSDLQQFRKRILERHNDIRTRVASDREHLQFCGKASNMNVLSYDLELEYVARCYAIKYVFHHDKCRRTSKRQSGRFFIVKDSSLVQVQFITNSTIDSYGGYRGIGNAHIEDFTQMVWWSHTHVGCARVYNPDAILKHDTYVLICNYGGSREANVVGEPVYKKGEPCTECPNNGKCNQSYLKLCGVLE
ncbi:unnamed protein product, partial [Tenebrio molitor]